MNKIKISTNGASFLPFGSRHAHRIYEVALPSATYFLQGSGTIHADFNRIRVFAPGQNNVVIKYHWVKGLSAGPDAEITPYKTDRFDVPFIAIQKKAGVDEVEIKLLPGSGRDTR